MSTLTVEVDMRESNKGKISLTSREAWSAENAVAIAGQLGYVSDEQFAVALHKFTEGTVHKARFTQFLGVLAHGYFKRFKPPLQRSPNGQVGKK